jgi:hypothetical protein
MEVAVRQMEVAMRRAFASPYAMQRIWWVFRSRMTH